MQFPSQRCDLHMHTCYSHDCATPLLAIRDLCRKKDLMIAATDHNEIKGNLALRRLGVNVVPGIEVTTKSLKDFLIYFYDEDNLIDFFERYVAPAKDPGRIWGSRTTLQEEDLLDYAKQYDSFISLAHPFCPIPKKSAGLPAHIIRKVDAIEVMNFGMSPRANQKAADMCDMTRKVHTAGSDSHHIKTLGAVQMLGHSHNPAEFLSEVAQGISMVVGNPRKTRDVVKTVTHFVSYKVSH